MRYDAATHTYTDDAGKVLPSVTTICKVASPYQAFGREEAMNDARDIGRDVHLITQLFDEGDLEESTVDPFYAGYLEAWRTFKKNLLFAATAVEEAIHHPKYGYAGTLDRVGFAKLGAHPERVLLDIKTGVAMPVAALQTAAYAEAWNVLQPSRKIKRRLAVYLRDDGSYLTEHHKEPSDFAVFLNALAIHRWRMLHK